MNFETSLPHEIESAVREAPVAYLPWGAHEWHGAHNPAGLDGLKAHYLAEELCREVGGMVFPTVFLGTGTVKGMGFPHSFSFSRNLVEQTAREYLNQFAEAGFRVIVIVLGHWGGGHGEIVRRAVDEFNASQSGSVAWAVQDDGLTGDFGTGDDHGGLVETSYMMAYLPGKVDLCRLPSDHDLEFPKDGVMGEDPRKRASAAFGREAAAIYVREGAKRIREMLERR